MAMRSKLEIPKRVYHLLKERGPKEAINYLMYRYLFGVHSLPVAKLLNAKAPYPFMVEIEPSTFCNLQCEMCENVDWDPKQKRNMSMPEFQRIMSQFPKLRWVGLTGIGESLCNPHFLDMCRYVKQKGTYLEIFDNFTLFTQDVARAMVAIGVNRIIPSIDGATAQTYEKIRKGANFDVVINNLINLYRIKHNSRRWLPEINCHFIVQRDNVHEMEEFVRLMRRVAGKQEIWVQFTEMFTEFPGAKTYPVEIPEEQIRAVKAEAKAQKVHLILNRNVGRNKIPYNRCSLWLQPFIFVDGSVMPCCGGNEAGRRYGPNGQIANRLGNVFETPFEEIWTGVDYEIMRDFLDSNLCPNQCVTCPTFGRK